MIEHHNGGNLTTNQVASCRQLTCPTHHGGLHVFRPHQIIWYQTKYFYNPWIDLTDFSLLSCDTTQLLSHSSASQWESNDADSEISICKQLPMLYPGAATCAHGRSCMESAPSSQWQMMATVATERIVSLAWLRRLLTASNKPLRVHLGQSMIVLDRWINGLPRSLKQPHLDLITLIKYIIPEAKIIFD